MCVHFSQVKVSNLILADHSGKIVEGDYAINRAGFVLHANVHEEHPHIVAMCHAHTVYGGAWASTGLPLEPITQDAAAFFEDQLVITAEAGAVAVAVAVAVKLTQESPSPHCLANTKPSSTKTMACLLLASIASRALRFGSLLLSAAASSSLWLLPPASNPSW